MPQRFAHEHKRGHRDLRHPADTLPYHTDSSPGVSALGCGVHETFSRLREPRYQPSRKVLGETTHLGVQLHHLRFGFLASLGHIIRDHFAGLAAFLLELLEPVTAQGLKHALQIGPSLPEQFHAQSGAIHAGSALKRPGDDLHLLADVFAPENINRKPHLGQGPRGGSATPLRVEHELRELLEALG